MWSFYKVRCRQFELTSRTKNLHIFQTSSIGVLVVRRFSQVQERLTFAKTTSERSSLDQLVLF